MGNVDAGDLGNAILLVGLMPASWWFYGHCIRPALILAGVRHRGFVLVQVLGLVGVGSSCVLSLADQFGRSWSAPMALQNLAAVAAITYFCTYLVPGVIARLSGGSDPLIALRYILWGLGYALGQIASGSPDKDARKDAQTSLDLLGDWRGEGADRLVTLGKEEAATILDGGYPTPDFAARHGEIRDEARRLWPSGEDWTVAAPFQP